MSVLKRIRKSIREHNDNIYYGDMEDTARMIENFHEYNEENSEIVKKDTEDRGDRWTNWDIEIYKLEVDDEVAYFKIEESVGKTELQSNNGCIVVEEVTPKEVMVIQYVNVNEISD